MVLGINAIVAEHFKMLLWDMYINPFDKIRGRGAFGYGFVVFLACVMEGDKISIIVINSRSGNHRSAKIAADVFDCDIGSAQIGFGPNIEAILMLHK